MEIALVILGLVGVIVLLIKTGGRSTALAIHKEKDIKLETEQEVKEKELAELEKEMNDLEMRLKKMTPKEIEDYWNDKNNN